jgi:uncharacterized hydrophobic protein (TIGR00271 family)
VNDEGNRTPAPAGEAVRRSFWTPRPDDEFDLALGELFFEGHDATDRLWRFAALIVLSSSIAGFGLLADSAGVVIGAMLVAPLMTPIQALGAALVRGSAKRIVVSALVILGGLVGAVATGYLVSVIGGGVAAADALPKEILARTAPGLLDLAIAVAAGAAGGYVIARPSVSGALPGVGIAVALVPPLATVGICLQLGLGAPARGALLLFATNLAAIVLSGAVMIFAAGFRPQPNTGRRARAGFIAAAVFVAAVAIPLAVHTRDVLADSFATRAVERSIPAWDPLVRVIELTVDDRSDDVVVELVVSSPRAPLSVWDLARRLRDELGKPVRIELRVQPESVDRAIAI